MDITVPNNLFTPPDIISCDDWGAADPKSAITVIQKLPIKIVIHHTASPNSTDVSEDHAKALARSIQQSHFGRGWIDSGQDFLVSRGGFILEGRHGSRDALIGGTSHVLGAHTTGQNNGAVGIENEGTYTSVTPPSELWQSLASLCAFICKQYKIGTSQIFGHRDFNPTQCPGDKFYPQLDMLRTAVDNLLYHHRCEVKDWFN